MRASAHCQAFFLCALCVLCSVAVGASAEVFTVTTTGDVGPGSLREAIAQANAQAGADEIVFDPALSGQAISLTSGQLTITGHLAITGPGAGLLTVARDPGAPDFRIFDIDDGDGGTEIDVVIAGLTISGGSVYSDRPDVPAEGGGVRTRERLVLRDATVSGNQAVSLAVNDGATAEGGGVHSSTYLVLANTTISGNLVEASEASVWPTVRANGGGVLAQGYLRLDTATITGNRAETHAHWNYAKCFSHGGGIDCGAATVRNSTISGNRAFSNCFDYARGYGGGIYSTSLVIDASTVGGNYAGSRADALLGESRGGGIKTGTLEMSSCTVSGNEAKVTDAGASMGGGLEASASIVIRNSTFTANRSGDSGSAGYGGGADLQTTPRLESTVFFGNTANTGPDLHCHGFSVVVCNLIGDPTDSSVPIGVDGNISGDPQLGPLADNGGPTLTHALPSESIAVDAGCNPANLNTDQRGYWPRDVGGVADIGAYEYGAVEVLFADDFESGQTLAWSLVSDVHSVSLPGGVLLEMARVPGGSLWMGASGLERGATGDESPRHQVTLTHDFYLGSLEVTQAQWQALMGVNPAHDHGVGDSYPVYYVSWEDIAGPGGFIERLNQHLTDTGQPGAGLYRLPTEAEWEHATRARTATRFSFGDALECSDYCQPCNLMGGHMWWCGNATSSAPVGSKNPNAFGLRDVHGNVAEWVADWYEEYPEGPQVDPVGPASGSFRAVRGGGWTDNARYARSASRRARAPSYVSESVGFRVARDVAVEPGR